VVLQQHKAVTDVISQQRKDLWKSQAQFAVLEAAATKRQLTTQEQSLLASKSSVLAYKARVAAVGDEVVLQERLNRLNDQADKYLLQQQTKRDALLASQTKSSREVQRGLERSQLLSGQKDNPRLNEMLDAQRKTWEQEDQLRSNWQAGGQKAWADYADAATDAYSVMKDAGGQALTGLSSQLTTFLTTGK
ncbi:phage tail tape measure protein, partial [Obesumbacterium proteus]|nr:phage tail tape measure protein [Obesumbacterium proteus]